MSEHERTSVSPAPDIVLAVEQLSVGYSDTPVIDGLSRTIERGHVTALVGPNG